MKTSAFSLRRKPSLLPLLPLLAIVFWSCTEQEHEQITLKGDETAALHALPENSIKILGLVFGDQGPLENAMVVTSDSLAAVVTDREGYFEIDVPEGSQLTFSAHGYTTLEWGRQFPVGENFKHWTIGVKLYRN
jgi:hypothetical protein